jgi:hypothetical protein
LVMVPPSEGGNVSSELAYFRANETMFNGVVLDDYVTIHNSLGQGFNASTYSYLEQQTTVCPVLYLTQDQPQETIGGRCLIVTVPIDLGAYSSNVFGQTDYARYGETLHLPASPLNFTVSQWEGLVSPYLATLKAQRILVLGFNASSKFWALQIPANYLTAMRSLGVDHGGFILWS